MFNKYKWNHTHGLHNSQKIQLIGLSTCSHCHMAKEYLEEKGMAFDWILLDEMEAENKRQFKKDFRLGLGQRLLFPSLVIDDKEVLVSFMKAHWDMSLII